MTRVRSDNDNRVRRRDRVSTAPGLTEWGMRKLTLRWIKQRRSCTYCPAPATTADHVFPLVRGGTNYEGNLTPCCKACNSRKSGLTLIEWRTGRRLPPMSISLDAMGRRKAPREPKPPKARPACRECDGECPPRRRTYCSEECSYAAFRDYMRDRYRTQAGIPLDQPRRKYTHAA